MKYRAKLGPECGHTLSLPVLGAVSLVALALAGFAFGVTGQPLPYGVTIGRVSDAGSVVTITGRNLARVTSVEIDGTLSSTFTVVSPTEITATVPINLNTARPGFISWAVRVQGGRWVGGCHCPR
jgi:hypothetical protein